MKKLPLTFSIILLAGCLLISTSILSNTPLKNPSEKASFIFTKNLHATSYYSPMRYFIPFYSFDQNVCRKPFTDHTLFTDFSSTYLFNGFSFNSQPLGTHFIYVNGNFTYKKGNTLLLIPHSYFLPLNTDLDSRRPSVILPGSN